MNAGKLEDFCQKHIMILIENDANNIDISYSIPMGNKIYYITRFISYLSDVTLCQILDLDHKFLYGYQLYHSDNSVYGPYFSGQ